MNLLDYLSAAFIGTPKARREYAQALRSRPSIESGLAELRRQGEADPSSGGEAPIFLLSAGWRSGSTLLQRLIMSDSRVMLWGEPYDECGIVQALAKTVTAFRQGWPPPEYYYNGAKPEQLSGDWIANLFPDASTLRHGHRAFFETTFAEPARRAGATRWGIKEVRLGVAQAHYLQWLYPDARFVFLYRNPLHAYQSYCRYGRNWYDIWPDKPVFTPGSFGKHWRDLTEGFLRDAESLNALVVRYEDFAESSADLLLRLEQHLGVRLDASVIERKIGSSARGGEQAWVSRLEKYLLQRAVDPLARELGYRW